MTARDVLHSFKVLDIDLTFTDLAQDAELVREELEKSQATWHNFIIQRGVDIPYKSSQTASDFFFEMSGFIGLFASPRLDPRPRVLLTQSFFLRLPGAAARLFGRPRPDVPIEPVRYLRIRPLHRQDGSLSLTT